MKNLFNGIKWHYASDEGQNWLKRLDISNIEGERIKSSSSRNVYKTSDGQYVKIVYYKSICSIIKSVTGGNAVKEGKIALMMAKNDISVPDILAFGTEKVFGRLYRDVLVTKEIHNGVPFLEFLVKKSQNLNVREKSRAIKEFAGFIRKLHDKGIFHKDFHFKNVIVQHDKDDVKFYILDLDKVVFKASSLPWKIRAKQLGIILSISWGLCSRSDRFKFAKYYGINLERKQLLNRFNDIMVNSQKHMSRLLAQRSRQSVLTNTRFIKEDKGGVTLCKSREFADAVPIDEILSNSFSVENDSMKFQLNNKFYFITRYVSKGLWAGLWSFFGRSYGTSTWKKIWRFPFGKIAIPTPFFLIEKKERFSLQKAYVISEYVEDAIPLNVFWQKINKVDKKRLCVKLGLLLGSLHQYGYCHGDLKWTNILIQPNSGDEKPILINIESSRCHGRLNVKKIKEDLSLFLSEMDVLNVSDEEKQLFKNTWKKWSGYY